ncbi:MAG: FHA domain-containing protein [Planctomycetes bacterium]|nr:FHA domain-containing protein [Planctomycetota bacterium]
MADAEPLRIRITDHDLSDPKIEEIVAQEQALRRPMPTAATLAPTPWYLNALFYTSVAGAFGAFLGWAIMEPFFDDEAIGGRMPGGAAILVGLLIFPVVGGMTGLMIGAIEGIMSRHLSRAASGSLIGLGLAFVLGLVSVFVAGILYEIVAVVMLAFLRPGSNELTGGVFFLQIVRRSMAWALAGMTVALGPGLALRSKKLTFNGFLGGMLGGAIGGLFFDPIDRLISGPGPGGGAEVSRCLGFSIVGGFAGLFVGLVEHFAKEAWLRMIAGPLAGKQFIVYKSPTVLGSSPKCEIYLFKDAGIEPRHAGLYKVGLRYEIEDYGTPGGTIVNGMPVKRQALRDGDRIVLGETVLTFSERPRQTAVPGRTGG